MPGLNGGASFGGGGGCAGGTSTQAVILDLSKERETRDIAKAMGGRQPNDFEWSIFFMRSSGGMSSETYEKMTAAHEAAKLLPSVDKQIDRIIEFLGSCGNEDIAAGIGYIFGNGSDEQIAAFRKGLANSVREPS